MKRILVVLATLISFSSFALGTFEVEVDNLNLELVTCYADVRSTYYSHSELEESMNYSAMGGNNECKVIGSTPGINLGPEAGISGGGRLVSFTTTVTKQQKLKQNELENIMNIRCNFKQKNIEHVKMLTCKNTSL